MTERSNRAICLDMHELIQLGRDEWKLGIFFFPQNVRSQFPLGLILTWRAKFHLIKARVWHSSTTDSKTQHSKSHINKKCKLGLLQTNFN